MGESLDIHYVDMHPILTGVLKVVPLWLSRASNLYEVQRDMVLISL